MFIERGKHRSPHSPSVREAGELYLKVQNEKALLLGIALFLEAGATAIHIALAGLGGRS